MVGYQLLPGGWVVIPAVLQTGVVPTEPQCGGAAVRAPGGRNPLAGSARSPVQQNPERGREDQKERSQGNHEDDPPAVNILLGFLPLPDVLVGLGP